MKRIICFLMLALVSFSTDLVIENTVIAATAEDFSISLPKRIEDTVPFFVKVLLGENAQVSVRWLGKDRKLSLTKQGRGYLAIGLFALPIDTPAGKQSLTLMVNGKSYQYSLQSSKRTYRTQSLSVNQSYVVPPQQEMAKINRDKAERNMVLATITSTRYWKEKGWVRPAQGLLTSPYGARRVYNGQSRNPHTALDFRAGVGAPIVTVAPGRVVFTGNQYFTGNTVYIDHGEGVISGYSHLSKILVQKGQMVRAGQRIGDAGATGRVTGPHLHLTMYSYGIPFDATSLILPNGR